MNRIYALMFAILGSFVMLTPVPANAQPAPPPQDCSAGCTIITCNATQCTVHFCNHSGCTVIGHYPKPKTIEN